MKYFYLVLFTSLLSIPSGILAQTQVWQNYTDSVPTLSSPRSADLNNDGVLDIVIGGGTDGEFADNGIMAFNGLNGSLLWTRSAPNEIFTSAVFQDITMDGIPDIFMGGRDAQLYAINGANGSLLWEYYTDPGNPNDIGLYNFYSAQFIPDADGDLRPDLLVANGGDHSLPLWETNRPPGHLMVISSLTGDLISMAVVPDSSETYCSPLVIDLQGDGILWILYGTGGESMGGSFYAVPLSELLTNTLANSVQLATHATRGFIAPASVHKAATGNSHDVIIQGFGGTVYKVNGTTLGTTWSTSIPGAESSAEAVIGNFTGDLTPDVFIVLFKGTLTSYTDYYQVMLDGTDGSIQFMDSLGALHFASANAVDLNNDGRDEAIISLNYFESGSFHHKLQSLDFQNNSLSQIATNMAGANIGSTPLITDIDNDGLLDIVYVVKKDSMNPMGWQGFYLHRFETASIIPNAGIAWGSYIGTDYDGIYNYSPVNCGMGSVVTGVNFDPPFCNGLSDGSLTIFVNGANDPHTFLWSTGEVGPTLSNIPAGTYSVRVTNSLGCYEDRNLILQDPYIISFGGIQAPTCPGDNNGMVTVNSTGCVCMFSGCTFLWDNGVAIAQNTQAASGYNYVTITRLDGCVIVDSVNIPDSPEIILDTVVTNLTCYENASGMISITPNPMFTVSYAWSTGESTNEITGLDAGDYDVTISDNRPCSQQLTFTVTQPDSLIANFTVSDVTCYADNNGSIEISATGGTPDYTYTVNGIDSSAFLYEGLSPGIYNIDVSDQNDCSSSSAVLTITEPDVLTSLITPTIESGPGALDGMAEIEVNGGTAPYDIFWSDPNTQTGTLAVYLSNGWYTATVTDSNGCVHQDSVYINTLSLSESSDISWGFYPNPAEDYLTLYVDGDVFYELIDQFGKVVLSGNEKTIRVEELSTGIYVLRVQTALFISMKKVIIGR
jgi:hypothetical protein